MNSTPKRLVAGIVQDSFFYLPAIIGPALFQLISIPFLTHLISPEEFGNYILVSLTISLLSIVGTSWIDSSTLRFYPVYQTQNKSSIFFSSILLLIITGLLGLSTVAFIFGLIFRPVITNQFYSMLIAGIISLPFFGSFYSSLIIFQASRRPKIYALLRLIFALLSTAVGLGLIAFFKFKASAMFLGWIIGSLILLPYLIKTLVLPNNFNFQNFSFAAVKEFFRYGAPFILSTLSWYLLGMIDRYFLKFFRGSVEVGIYSVSWTLSDKFLVFLFAILMTAAYPVIISTYESHGKSLTQQLMTRLVKYYFYLCLPALVLISLLASDVIRLFAAKEYFEGYKVMPYAALGAFSLGLTQYTSKSFVLEKKSHVYAWLILGAVIINVILNLILIPPYGFIGTAIAFAITQLALLIGTKLVADRYLPWALPWRSMLRTGFSSIIMVLVLLSLNRVLSFNLLTLVVKIVIGISVYFAMLLSLGEVRIRTLQTLWRIIGNLFTGHSTLEELEPGL